MTRVTKGAMLALLAAASLAAGCDLDESAGAMKSEPRHVPAFERIVVEGRTDVTVRTGTTQQVTLRGGDQLLDVVTTGVGDRTLTIDRSAREAAPLDVTVALPNLRGVESNSTGRIEILDVHGQALELVNDGVGQLFASGEVDELHATLSGIGDMRLADLTAERAVVRVSGIGSAEVDVTGQLEATVTGVGGIEYHGEPTVHRRIRGLGGISQAGA